MALNLGSDNVIITCSWVYVVVEKEKFEAAKSPEERRKAVIYWGITQDLKGRWNRQGRKWIQGQHVCNDHC